MLLVAMTTLADLFAPNELGDEIEAGYVTQRAHPTLPLSILTYTRPCQYEGHWTNVTRQCRGLVIEDDTGLIVARPFPKFFNVAEHHAERHYAPPLPVEPFRVYEKVDGSLGIFFCYSGKWNVASKGSFISEQAQWADRELQRHDLSTLDTRLTHLAEIIYPQNRIVVNYGDLEDLILLGAYHTNGREVDLDEIAWPLGSVVTTHASGTWGTWEPEALAQILTHTTDNAQIGGEQASGTNAEGYVIRFQSGVRAKAKFSEYVRLHRLLTGVTERDIWRALAYDQLANLAIPPKQLAVTLKCSVEELGKLAAAPNGAMSTIVEGVPDEFDAWTKGIALNLQRNAAERLTKAHRAVSDAPTDCARGIVARHIIAATDDKGTQTACFAILDGKPPDPFIWHSLYPAATTPFQEDDDG